jgi:hypothetical protein
LYSRLKPKGKGRKTKYLVYLLPVSIFKPCFKGLKKKNQKTFISKQSGNLDINPSVAVTCPDLKKKRRRRQADTPTQESHEP